MKVVADIFNTVTSVEKAFQGFTDQENLLQMPMKLLETSPASRSRIYKEFSMTPRGVAQDVAALKDWLAKQPHLPIIRGGELRFLFCMNSRVIPVS